LSFVSNLIFFNCYLFCNGSFEWIFIQFHPSTFVFIYFFISNWILILLMSIYSSFFFILFLIIFFQFIPKLFVSFYFFFKLDFFLLITICFLNYFLINCFFNFIPQYFVDWVFVFMICFGLTFYKVGPDLIIRVTCFEDQPELTLVSKLNSIVFFWNWFFFQFHP
jgi:hypothetical protein